MAAVGAPRGSLVQKATQLLESPTKTNLFDSAAAHLAVCESPTLEKVVTMIHALNTKIYHKITLMVESLKVHLDEKILREQVNEVRTIH